MRTTPRAVSTRGLVSTRHSRRCARATLVVWKLDRLGRDLRHLVNTVHDLTKRGIGLKVLAGAGAAVDTTTPAGKLTFGIFAALAEFERELISERTKAGLGAGSRPKGRTAVQDDARQAQAGHGGDGSARDERRRPLPRDQGDAPDALPARGAGRESSRRRTEASGGEGLGGGYLSFCSIATKPPSTNFDT